MSDLFNKEDVLTGITADQAVVGTKGYFGGGLRTIAYNVEQDNVHRLCAINEDETSCFTDEEGLDYLFFLPADRVKNKVKEPVYRPIKTIDELFNFLIPDFDADAYGTYEKVVLTLLKIYELKEKLTGNICYRRFSQIYLSDNYIRLDECNLEHLFKTYEIKKDDEFVPFGIKEE